MIIDFGFLIDLIWLSVKNTARDLFARCLLCWWLARVITSGSSLNLLEKKNYLWKKKYIFICGKIKKLVKFKMEKNNSLEKQNQKIFSWIKIYFCIITEANMTVIENIFNLFSNLCNNYFVHLEVSMQNSARQSPELTTKPFDGFFLRLPLVIGAEFVFI